MPQYDSEKCDSEIFNRFFSKDASLMSSAILLSVFAANQALVNPRNYPLPVLLQIPASSVVKGVFTFNSKLYLLYQD
jgi:hypothetical protein